MLKVLPLFQQKGEIMEKQYKLLDVVHSGRKGIRGTTICDRKYEGILGFYCRFDLDDIQQFKPFTFDVINSWYYDWWTTSEVLEATVEEGIVQVETANSIYRFKEVMYE